MSDPHRDIAVEVADDVGAIVENLRWWLSDPTVSRRDLSRRVTYAASLIRPIAFHIAGRDLSHGEMAKAIGATQDMARRAYDRLDTDPCPPLPADRGTRDLRLAEA